MRNNYREYYIIYEVIKENDNEKINKEIEELKNIENKIQICNINYNINHIINNKTKNIQNNTNIEQQNVIKINKFGIPFNIRKLFFNPLSPIHLKTG